MTYSDPFRILTPNERWTPSQTQLDASPSAQEKLLPPLVHQIRFAVAKWREDNYKGASETSKSLLHFWFNQEHNDGFHFYFSQREAIESIIYLYEVAKAHDKYDLMRFNKMGNVSPNMFDETWTRYVVKMATGAGKTKVMGLALVWSYFHKLYEADSALSKNFLVIAPNLIVLNRLKKDFVGKDGNEHLKMFFEEPFLPDDGVDGRDWRSNFQLTVHIQDELKPITEGGNIFLTNVHRIFFNPEPALSLAHTFLGPTVKPKADTSKGLDLGEVLRSQKIQDLVVLNDEAHHIHDKSLAWFKNIEDISHKLTLKNGKGLALQTDFSATPKHNNGSIFVQTISDYPLVEAIKQGVVKSPVLPDLESRKKIVEKDSTDFEERYGDFIRLGYEEWKQQYDELTPLSKTPILFVMTMSTEEADKAKIFLEREYTLMNGSVLVIHTNKSGETKEAKSKKDEEELRQLRKAADDIDKEDSPYRAVVSVLMLREGWDVQNVTTVVGLRAYGADSKILPEQTIGRGLRKMSKIGDPQKLVVVGTEHFLKFVEELKTEGVEFQYSPMGKGTKKKPDLIIEVDKEHNKNLDALDIPVPQLTPRVFREYKNLELIDTATFSFLKAPFKLFAPKELKEIIFEDIDGDFSHKTIFGESSPDYRNVLAFFTSSILKDSRLVAGFSVLYPKVEQFIRQQLFGKTVDLSDANVIKNVAEAVPKHLVFSLFKKAINDLTIKEDGTVRLKGYASLKDSKPKIVQNQPFLMSDKCIFTHVVGDNPFELDMAVHLNRFADVKAFAKNGIGESGGNLFMEYQKTNGTIALYYPDFLIRTSPTTFFILETKGREDLNDVTKIKRLVAWCQDINALQSDYTYTPLYVKQEDWDVKRKDIKTFADVQNIFKIDV